MKKTKGIPPLFDGVNSGKVQWKSLDDIDFESLGHFLSLHLIIEHYIDEFLKVYVDQLNWDDAKLTFAQKLSLIKDTFDTPPYFFYPPLKHFNSLRNKFSHQINYKITEKDLQPITNFLKNVDPDYKNKLNSPEDTIDFFTLLACSWLASAISFFHRRKKTNPTKE